MPTCPPLARRGAGSGETASPAPEAAGEDAWAGLADIDADVALKMDSLTYDGIRLAGLELDAAHNDGNLTLRRAQVADVAGSSVSVSGTARTVWSAPTVDLAIESTADSLEGVVAFLDIEPRNSHPGVRKVRVAGAFSRAVMKRCRSISPLRLAPRRRLLKAPSTIRSARPPAPSRSASAHRILPLWLAPQGSRRQLLSSGSARWPSTAEIGGTLDSVAVNLSAEAAGATVTASGKVTEMLTSPGYSVDVDLAHPNGEALVETMIGEAPAGATLGPVRLVGKVSGDRMVANLAGIDGCHR